ncbi:MAG: TolC family protein [Bdellovibrio sp.]|nr:MAG: TolC family protein [Bdellovibrio sp.]
MLLNKKLLSFFLFVNFYISLIPRLTFANPQHPSSGELAQLIQEALKNNPELSAIKNQAEKYRYQFKAAGSYDDPQITYEVMNLPIDTYSLQQTPMSGKKVSISQKIPFPGKLSTKQKAAYLQFEASLHRFKQKQYEIIYNVKKNYYELFKAIKTTHILEEQKKLIKQLIVSARSKYTLGKIPQTEVINFQMEETDLISKILISKRKITIAKNNLAKVIGSSQLPFPIKALSITKKPLEFNSLNAQNLVKRVLSNNHLLKAFELQRLSSEKKIQLSKLEYFPDFNLKASYTFREPNPSDEGTDFTSFMASINIPLWFFSKQNNNVRSTQSALARATSLVKNQKLKLINLTQNIYAELEESSKTLMLFEKTLLPLAKQAVRSGKSAYLSGKVDYSTLLASINTRFNTELKFYFALANYETLVAKLEALLAEPINKVNP